MSSRERLQELATCPVCLDLLERPKMLPCQHTFCLLCVQKCTVGIGEAVRLRCAQCRGETPLPKDGVTSLPGNIYLQSILDLLKSDYGKGEERPHCSSCQTVCEVDVCQHCSRWYCRICSQRHLVELQGQLQCIYEQLESTKNRVAHRINAFQESCSRVKDAIHLETQNRVQQVLDTEAQLVQRVDHICVQERGSCEELVHRMDATGVRVQELLRGDFEQAGSWAEKVALFLGMHRESSDALTAADGLTLATVTFTPDTFSVSSTAHPDSSAADEEEDEEEDPPAESSRLAPPVLGSGTGSNGAPKSRESDNAHSRSYRARLFHPRCRLGAAFMQRPSGVAVSPWSSEIFVVSMDNHRVHVFDLERGKFQRSFGMRGQGSGEFLCPFGIALSSATQEILVTDKWKHCIHVFNREEQFLRQIGAKGSGPAHFRSPESICVDQNGRIYVCDTCNNRIQVLDKDGSFIREIDGLIPVHVGHSARQRSMFQEPAGIAVSRDGQRLAVCDFGNHRIHVFCPTGTHLLTCGQKGALRGQFIHPECVAVDSHGFIFVGDSGNGRVQILRPDGRFVRAFGSKGSQPGQFSWISGIAVTDTNGIVVCDFKNHCVQIF